jgi:hypothetical protein
MDRDNFIIWIAEKRKDFLSNLANLANSRDENLSNFIRGQLSGLKQAEDFLLEQRSLSCSTKQISDMLQSRNYIR